MKTFVSLRDAWMKGSVMLLVCIGPMVGCQNYQPVPVDLESYREHAASRLDEQETLRAFSQRLLDDAVAEPGVFDLADGMDSAEAEVVALFYNRDLRLARLRAGIALANRETAGLWEDPVFGFDGAELLSPNGPFEFGLIGGLTLPISGRLAIQKDQASAAYAAQLARLVDAEWNLRAEVRKAWAKWSASDEQLKLIDQVLAAFDRVIAVSNRLVSAGELKRIEARLLQTERVGLLVERVAAQAAMEQARLDLLGLMGLLPSTNIELVPGLPSARLPDVKDDLARLIDANTKLSASRADYAVAEQSLRLAVREQYPDLDIGFGYGSEDDDDRLLLGASIRIPLLNANRNEIAKAHAERELARADVQAQFESLAFMLSASLARIEAARQQRNVLQGELSPMLDEQAKEIGRLAELGEVDVLILLQSTQRQFNAKRATLDLQLSERLAEIDLARMLGPDEVLRPVPVESTQIKRESHEGYTP